MLALVRSKGGKNFSSLQLKEVSSPVLKENEIKIKVASSRINPADMDLVKGFPGLKYKDLQFGGVDGAGEVIDNNGSERFQVGDKVFFYCNFNDFGTWAEEITIDEAYVAKIPDHLSIIDAGAIALPLLTAYESILSLGAKTGETVLIHGAGGGVGFLATQIAKALGLKIIANASGRDEEVLDSIGVEKFINYREQSFDQVLSERSVDYVFDVVGKETLIKSLQLKPKKVVSVAFVDPANMWKCGVELSGIMKFIINMMMGKFRKAAKKNSVELISQVTGGNGKVLGEASEFAAKNNFQLRPYKTIPITSLEQEMINEKSLTKVLTF